MTPQEVVTSSVVESTVAVPAAVTVTSPKSMSNNFVICAGRITRAVLVEFLFGENSCGGAAWAAAGASRTNSGRRRGDTNRVMTRLRI